MAGRLEGKVALITGAASGIGAATARLFAAEGAAVLVTDRDESAGPRVAREIATKGGLAEWARADVTDLVELENAVALARSHFGGLDVLVANAGASGGGYVGEIDPAVWRSSVDVLLTGVFLSIRAALPAMLARGGGAIVATASVEAITAERLSAPYNAAKAGVVNLIRTVAIEYGRRRIRANAVCPGCVDTPMLDLVLAVAPTTREELAAKHALGRILRPEEIARVIAFLASDEASAVTGAAVVVDGGLTADTGITGFPPFGV